MSIANLPRGVGDSVDARSATARWATAEEIAEHRFKPGDIWLGTLPCPSTEAWPKIEAAQRTQTKIARNERFDPAERERRIAALQTEINALSETDAIDIGAHDDRHHITVAGTRSGKGTTLIRANLERYTGSLICIDPKGENARWTAAHRAMEAKDGGRGQSVCVLDPYRVTGFAPEQLASWNPLDLVKIEDEEAIDRASSIADALIMRSNGEHVHFDDNARSLVKALILYVSLKHERRPTRNLVTVHHLLMRGAWAQLRKDKGGPPEKGDPSPFQYLLQLMVREEAVNGVIAGAAETILQMGERERGSVLSTARRNLEFLERTPIRRTLRQSSFDLDRLKTDPAGMSVYLCLPPQRMPDCGRWLRLIVTAALERLYEIESDPATGHPVLFLMEEFATLGHMPSIEHAAGYAAGFGVKLWLILQDLAQLKHHYREGWETFVGNAGIVQSFANSDEVTLEYLSKRLGETEIVQSSHSITTSQSASSNDPGAQHRLQTLMQNRGQASLLLNPLGLLADPASSGQSVTSTEALNRQPQRVPLLRPDEIERAFAREALNQILLIKGARPIALKR